MKLVLLYGPPAAGKLTVAKALAAQTGYALIDNHRATDYLLEVFPRSEERFNEVRTRLGRRARLDIFAEAAKADVNLIGTFAPIADGWEDFMRDIRQVVEENGGEICFVQLLPTRDVLVERTVDPSRSNKISTVERWNEVAQNHPHIFATFPDFEHLVLDNSTLSPEQAAQKIIQTYNLR